MRILVKSKSENVREPYAHLMPIIQELIKHGNEVIDKEIFKLYTHDVVCFLKRPIDFDVLESTVEFPANIKLIKDKNSILDKNTWVEIRGGLEQEK